MTNTLHPLTTTVFQSGTSQAVRIPKEFRFPKNLKQVEIIREGNGVLILPKDSVWTSYFEDPRNQDNEKLAREQPEMQSREEF